MVKVTIDRKKWLHGEGSTRSFLLRKSDQKMCCLGFCMLALGYKKDEIVDQPMPANVVRTLEALEHGPPGLNKLVYQGHRTSDPIVNTDGCSRAAVANDYNRDDSKRENKISEILLSLGFEVEFVGEY